MPPFLHTRARKRQRQRDASKRYRDAKRQRQQPMRTLSFCAITHNPDDYDEGVTLLINYRNAVEDIVLLLLKKENGVFVERTVHTTPSTFVKCWDIDVCPFPFQ